MAWTTRASWRAGVRHPLVWILLLGALLRWQASGYVRSSDDLDYALAARSLLEGTYRPGGNFHHLRLGVIVPTALSFALFGCRYWASLLWPVAASLLSIGVLYRVVL